MHPCLPLWQCVVVDGRMRPFRYYARRSGNSTFEPSVHPPTLLSFTSASGKPRPDSIVDALKSAHRRYGKRRLHVLTPVSMPPTPSMASGRTSRFRLADTGILPWQHTTPASTALPYRHCHIFHSGRFCRCPIVPRHTVSDACATADSILK